MKTSVKQTWELIKLDWKRIFKNKLTFLLIIALMVIPSLYAWFNIAALWDPYSNTKDIAIAVYSDDQTAEVMGKKINVGDKIIDGLHDNHKVGWRFVKSKEELDKGVKSGKYYGGVYMPTHFSEDLVSFLGGEITKPKIEYSVNQKINAIAPKITDKGASGIQDTVTKEFISAVSTQLVQGLNEVGINLDTNFLTIDKISNKILAVNDNMDEIDEYVAKVGEVNKKMPEFKGKLAKANEFIDYIPEINKLGAKIVDINGKFPELQEKGALILDVQKKIPEIEQAGKQLNEIDNDFSKVEKIMNDGITSANDGLKVIKQVQGVMPQVADLAKNSNALLNDLNTKVPEWSNQFDGLADTVIKSLQLGKTTVDNVINVLDGIRIIEGNETQVADTLGNLAGTLSSQIKILNGAANILESLQNFLGDDRFADSINRFRRIAADLEKVAIEVKQLEIGVRDGSIKDKQLQDRLAPIKNGLQGISNEIGSLLSSDIAGQMKAAIASVQKIINDASKITGKVVDEDLVGNVNHLLAGSSETISGGIELLEKYQKELPAIKQEIHDANEMLNNNMGTIVGGINKAASVYTDDLPKIQEKLGVAATFINEDLPGIEKDVKGTLEIANEKFPQLETALSSAQSLIDNEWPTIKKGIAKAADLIEKGRKDIDLAEVMKILKADASKESDFLANPVLIDQHDIYPVPNNGSASAPFYTALCLWVGAVLFSSIASTDFHLSADQKKKYSKRQQFLARMTTFLIVGFFQSLIVALGNQYLLGTYTKAAGFNILFSIFVGLTFMMMVYVLVALLGNLGKGAAVIILVLSISGGGGNYPIEMSGKFFQLINPFLPFTHAVNLLRESVGGIYWPNASKAIVILFGVGLAFFIIGTAFFPQVKKHTKKLNEKLKEGHILH